MPGRKLKLNEPEVAARIDEMHAREPDGWRKTRLLAVKLAARGESTAAQIGDLCGIARGHVFVWLGIVRERGLEALLERGKPGPAAGTCRGVKAKVIAQLKGKLEAHEFANAQQARRWLKKAHGIERPYASVWNWLKKERRSAAGAASEVTPGKSWERKKSSKSSSAKSSKASGLRLGAGSRCGSWMRRGLACTPGCGGCGRCAGGAP